MTEGRLGRRRSAAPVPLAPGLPYLGNGGEPLAPIALVFKKRGITPPYPSTISKMRHHERSGIRFATALTAAEIAVRGSVPNKDTFFARYGVFCFENRVKRMGEKLKGFRVRGLTADAAEHLGIPLGALTDLVRALRIDLFYTPEDQLGPSFTETFGLAVNAYLRNLRRNKLKYQADEMCQKWDKTPTVSGFYKMLFEQSKGLVAAWTPYEAEAILVMAGNRLKTHHSPVTPFDRWILTGVDGDRSDKAIINKIKSDLGITVTKHVVDYYRALLMGRIIAKPQEMDQVVAK